MKKLLALCIAISLFACKKEEPKDYVTVSGKIENPHESKTLIIAKGRDFEKVITLADDGTFSDTLKVTEGDYSIKHGERHGIMYLKNNNESTLNTIYESFTDSMVFDGDASDINNFSIQSFLIGNEHFTQDLISSGTKEDLDLAVKNYKSAYEDLKKKYVDVDSAHVAQMDRNIVGQSMQLQQYMASKIAMRAEFPKGNPSPTFKDYENFAGGNTSLSDLKGKYVYIDVWATWCGPCIAEIPSLKKIEKQFHGKNIEFVSLSIDEGRGYKGNAAEAYKGWRKMIKDKELGGMQLLADKGFTSDFIKAYKINGIPRFILIDPQGNIVNADAPRPSSPQLVEIFNGLEL